MAVRVSAQGASPATPGPRRRFAAATGQLGNGTRVVSVMGELDLAAVPAFDRTLLDVIEAGTGEVIVDLTGCSFLDSRGLRALIAAKEWLERSDRSLALVISSPIVMRIFQLTRFDERFDIRPSLSAAGNGNGNRNGHG
jgi:anti-sigma B factor antagonist